MEKKWVSNIVCEQCGYQNHKYFVDIYGTCNLCGKVLDPKAKYRYEMKKRLRLNQRKPKKRNINEYRSV